MSEQPKLLELRVAVTVENLDEIVAFYRDTFGLEKVFDWNNPDGRGVVLKIDHATLELVDSAQAETIDRVEAGKRVSGKVRFAIGVESVPQTALALIERGASAVNEPVLTPWGDYNQRVQSPDGMQITLFEEKPAE